MWNEPRNWKWMVPGALFTVLTVVGAWLFAQDANNSRWWGWGSVWGVAFVFFLAWITNWWAYIAMHIVNNSVALRKSQYETPEVRMFEAAKGMHPESVASLLAHRRLIWEVEYLAVGDMIDWVLHEAPSVRLGFVDFVLEYSNGTSVMPKSMLSQGSKQFDPTETFTDYEQYDALILLMQHLFMCTEALGNQAPKWIAPWTPELVRHRFGLESGFYEAEGTNMMQAVERAREARAAEIAGAGARADPLRAVKDKIEQDALDGLEQTAEMRKKYQSSRIS